MSHFPSTFENVELAFVARIAALDASAYTLGRRAAARWHESKTPLTVVADPSSLGHLSFGVWIQSAPNTGDGRGTTWVQDDIANDVEIDARVRVAFAFELRATKQVPDARIATRAALDVIRALMAPWSALDETTWGTVTVRLIDGLQTGISLDGHWLLVTQDFVASFDLDLLPSG